MKFRKYTILLILVIFPSVLLSACGNSEPTVDINMQKTSFAQTADAQASQTAQAQPTATSTIEPTITLTPDEALETQETLSSTASDETAEETVESTATSIVVNGTDAGTWRSQDVADNTEFSPGEEFTVTWTIENTGSTTWTTSYYIEFTSGEQMGAEDQIYLPYSVAPNTNVQISADFTAPSTTGEYQSDWNLTNAGGTSFSYFYIIIEVVEDGES